MILTFNSLTLQLVQYVLMTLFPVMTVLSSNWPRHWTGWETVSLEDLSYIKHKEFFSVFQIFTCFIVCYYKLLFVVLFDSYIGGRSDGSSVMAFLFSLREAKLKGYK